MSTTAQVILVRHDGALILQEATSPADPTSTGRVTAFGGEVPEGLTPHAIAEEALAEQTNLPEDTDHLVFWRQYPKPAPGPASGPQPDDRRFYFLYHGVSSSQARGAFGEKLVVVHNPTDARKLNMSAALRRALTDYFHERENRTSARS
ncbi:MAG TPA: hypothetical protein VI322_03735 [Candidatus Saccharimonadia bacterium]